MNNEKNIRELTEQALAQEPRLALDPAALNDRVERMSQPLQEDSYEQRQLNNGYATQESRITKIAEEYTLK